MLLSLCDFVLFFFNDTATTEIYTLSLHDALPIFSASRAALPRACWPKREIKRPAICGCTSTSPRRSEEHTSELQSHLNLVCRLLLEKKKETYHCLYTIGADRLVCYPYCFVSASVS